MSFTIERARDLVESVFSFDYVGDSMSRLRSELSSKEAKQELVNQLVECSQKQSSDSSDQAIQLMKQAANEQVEQFIENSKANEFGCGGMTKL
jgi:hypothetical protein